jgi:hypothetical protein
VFRVCPVSLCARRSVYPLEPDAHTYLFGRTVDSDDGWPLYYARAQPAATVERLPQRKVLLAVGMRERKARV